MTIKRKTLDEGKLFQPEFMEKDLLYNPCELHPDTGCALEGHVVPHWDELVKLCKSISEYIPMTPYLVVDIIPTQDGFSILEINSHGQVRKIQPFYPFCENKYNCKVFNIERYIAG